ncbi:CcmD family protein [bacterium]|nr:CcmD family protein [bacterium]
MRAFLLSVLSLMLMASPVGAQRPVEMADQFRADGKIYVVIGVLAIIWVGLIAGLFFLERRIGKLEQGLRNGVPKTSNTSSKTPQ